jgi:hypothetical protein
MMMNVADKHGFTLNTTHILEGYKLQTKWPPMELVVLTFQDWWVK